MLYTLNLYNGICQLYINETGNKMKFFANGEKKKDIAPGLKEINLIQ